MGEKMRFARKELGKHQEYNVKKASSFEKQLKQREKLAKNLKTETKSHVKKKRVLKTNFLDSLEEKLEKFDKKAKKLEKKQSYQRKKQNALKVVNQLITSSMATVATIVKE